MANSAFTDFFIHNIFLPLNFERKLLIKIYFYTPIILRIINYIFTDLINAFKIRIFDFRVDENLGLSYRS